MSSNIFQKERVCPWWMCFTFDNIVRRLFHDPQQILGRYFREGMTALDIGPGMGYFSIPMAAMVGAQGKVIAVDVQQKMLDKLQRRAEKSGIANRILTHRSDGNSVGITHPVDFILVFWMVHEVPDQDAFWMDLHGLLKENGLLLVAEPSIHVSKKKYADTIRRAEVAGFTVQDNPPVWFSYATLLIKKIKTN
jgi:2-polyprenyl-3-methyl-5-hydroxy-6-metoxy-1,4-benzoquinol methylase